MTTKTRTTERLLLTLALLALLVPIGLVGVGCETTTGGGGGGNAGAGDNVEGDGDTTDEAEILALGSADLAISGAQDLTITYRVPSDATSVRAFRVLEDLEDDANEWVFFEFSTALAAGSSSFTINTGNIPRGRHRIGISYVRSGTTNSAVSKYALVIQGLPEPIFVVPDEDLEVVAGTNVQLIVDMGDPEDDVDWRLFFINDVTAPGLDDLTELTTVKNLGNTIGEPGTGNVANLIWSTESVALGTYRLGVSATDGGLSIAESTDLDRIVTVYADLLVSVIEEEPEAQPPSISVTAPAADVTTFLTETVDITFFASTNEGTEDDLVVFWDTDSVFSIDELEANDERIIADGLTTSATSVSLSTADLDEGIYYLGVYVDDGLNEPVANYAPGTLTVVKTPSLDVTAPASGEVITPTQTATIAWSTNVPATAAQLEVFVLADTDGDGSGDGDKIVVQELGAISGDSVAWTPTGQVGRYLVFVRLVFNDDSIAEMTDQAPGYIRVSTAPQVIWVGEFAQTVDEDDVPAGAIFGGHQFEDNLGSAFSPVGDLDGDGADEFLINARYGKPFFFNADGIGHGEAYLIYGSRDRLNGVYTVNSVGTESLRGVTFTGIRTMQGNTETDGLSDISRIPDVDGDDKDELVFGFPRVESRGHNVDPDQNGVKDPSQLSSLERPNQFTRGGVVIVSSTNSILGNPDSGTPVINLDLVGQNFERTCVLLEPTAGTDLILDLFSIDAETGTCFNIDDTPNGGCSAPATDSIPDGLNIRWGFVTALADDYFVAMRGRGCLTEYDFHLNPCRFNDDDGISRVMSDYCTSEGPGICQPSSPALHGAVAWHRETTLNGNGYSGYYPDQYIDDTGDEGDEGDEGPIRDNDPVEPFGARIIGVGVDDGFGTSLTLSDPIDDDSDVGDIIVSAPNRTARGILFQQTETWDTTWPETGGEIDGLERPAGTPATNQDSGMGYLFDLRSLWTEQGSGSNQSMPPKPHQYIVGEPSHCGRPDGGASRISNVSAVRIAGAANEKITNVLGIKDFNADGRNDFAVGAPLSDRVYISFRRETSIESDYVLEKLELGTGDPQRLSGALITGTNGSAFGTSMATGLDLNGDDQPDLIVSAPEATSNAGEVAIIFSSPDLITGQGGVDIDTLVAQGRAAKITGRDSGDYFGFNIVNGGDIDGDGKDDLLVAAPGGTPRYDSNPFDDDDSLDTLGLDLDGDGSLDNLTGPNGVIEDVDGGEANDDFLDELHEAGLVYIIWGSNVVEGEVSISDLGASGLEGAIVVGRRGNDPSAGRSGDFAGGGDAGDTNFGGINGKADRGRSFGLRAAGDVDGDGLDDFLIGSIIATPRIDPTTGEGTTRGGEAYLVYGFNR